MHPRRRHSRDEDGIFLILFSVFVIGLLSMVAIVLDLGALRSDRRKSRAAADAAATAGAQALALGSSSACSAAWQFALVNLGISSATSPCTAFATCDPVTPITAVRDQTIGTYTIAIAYPVADDADGAAFLEADAVGPDIAQPPDADADGTECERIGVRIELTRAPIFARIMGNRSNQTSAHSVARYMSVPGGGGEKPALVALHPTDDCTIESGPGMIRAMPTGTQPALIYADSDASGPNCSGGSNTVFEGKNPGRIFADPVGANPGELGYFAATEALAFDTQPTYDENGALPPVGATKVRLVERITRRPLDVVYNCGSVVPALPAVPGCTTGIGGTDLISDVSARYGDGTTAPAGFTTFPGPMVAGTCTGPPSVFPPGINWYVNCPNFQVAAPVTFQNMDVVFSGNVEIKGGGVLNFNSLNVSDTTVVIRGTTGITTASGGWALNWNRTFLLMDNATCSRTSTASCGVIQFQVGQPSSWTPPTGGLAKNLIYWSESRKDHSVQGNPNFLWDGIFAAPNSLFDVQGNALVDATDVQLWVSKARVNNQSAELRLRADPDKSITTSRAASALIR